MCLPQTGIKVLYYWSISFLCLILFGCANTPFSSIQNIRQIENTTETRNGEDFTLMTFNIRAGGGTENLGMSPRYVKATEEKLIQIADAIKSVDPDIVGLQEVRGYNQVKFIAEKLNMNFAYRTHGGQSWWGLAFLSKYKIVDIKSKFVNFGGNYGDRIALMYNVDLNGKPVSIINVHYALENYKGQIRATMKFLDETEGPIVLIGDLNRYYYHPELKPIKEKLLDTCYALETNNSKKACGTGTFGGFMLPEGIFVNGVRIDYIFVDSKNFNVIDVGLTPMEYFYVSDHRAFWSNIRIKD